MRMRYFILSCLLTISNIFAQGGISYIKPAKENLRLTPNGIKLGELTSGTRVEILERNGDWVKVQLQGWIWASSLVGDSTQISGFTIRASHILVKTETEATRLLQEIQAGASFEDLAKKNSLDQVSGQVGGDLGKFGRGDLRPEFDRVLFSMKVGEVRGVIKTELGYHIIKRTE